MAFLQLTKNIVSISPLTTSHLKGRGGEEVGEEGRFFKKKTLDIMFLSTSLLELLSRSPVDHLFTLKRRRRRHLAKVGTFQKFGTDRQTLWFLGKLNFQIIWPKHKRSNPPRIYSTPNIVYQSRRNPGFLDHTNPDWSHICTQFPLNVQIVCKRCGNVEISQIKMYNQNL